MLGKWGLMNLPYVNIHAHRESLEGEIVPVSLGLHPWNIDFENYPSQIYFVFREVKEILGGFKDSLLEYPLNKWYPMIGECGFDKLKTLTWELQEEVFLSQVTFAQNHQLPVVVHCVRAWENLWAVYDKVQPTKPWIIHGFQSSKETLKEVYRRNMYVSFGTQIMDTQSKAARALQSLSQDCVFFLETDDTDIPITDVYAAAAELRNISLEELKQIQWDKAFQLLQRK